MTTSIADRIREALAGLPEVELAALFGSAARDRARPDSDVDVGLVVDDPSPERFAEISARLHRALGRDIDLVDLSAAPPLLRFELARDGVPLVERRPYRWADFRAQAMLDWWDWEPYARRLHDAAIARLRQKVSHGP
ncbi:MAG TPA: nucleotidyltransferase domain-containing protein [Thermoanaerobaculia bacterium]|nr:nucleotidyltransferase domain-containing protein [Thermoanaerobaculia bacterium]